MGPRALEAGKHILLAKSSGTSVDDLHALYELACASGLHIQTDYQWRYNPGLKMIQSWVRDGLLGRVNLARFPRQQRARVLPPQPVPPL